MSLPWGTDHQEVCNPVFIEGGQHVYIVRGEGSLPALHQSHRTGLHVQLPEQQGYNVLLV